MKQLTVVSYFLYSSGSTAVSCIVVTELLSWNEQFYTRYITLQNCAALITGT